MRRIYYMKPKQRPVVQDALMQMRATQKALGPELMTRIRLLFKDFDPAWLEKSAPGPEAWAPPAANAGLQPGEEEPVDRRKNLLTIMKFLQMNPDNKNVQTQIRTLLSETNTVQ